MENGGHTTLTFPPYAEKHVEEITETDKIRFERLYEIVREFPRGAAATFVEKVYIER